VLCKEDSEEVTTKYHLLQVKPSFGEDTAQASTPADSASGEQKAKRIEVKNENRKSQDRSRRSCEGTKSTAPEISQKRRPLFLTAGHMVTLNPQKMIDFAGTPLEGNNCTLLSNCISYCTESARNEYKYPTILYSWLLYCTVRALILLRL